MSMYLDRSKSIGDFVPEPDDDLIICRCEEITKGEIRRAVHEGMWTMTEVKRFIRAGMGLCQGQTCGKLVKSVIARELGVKAGEVAGNVDRAPARPLELYILGNEGEGVMADHSEVLIIGAGIIGCGTAYYLAKKGVSVTVLEREMIGHGGSCRNAGGIRQSARDIRELPLAMYSVEHIWPGLDRELGVDIEYHPAGNIRLGLTERHMEILEKLADNCRADGLDVRMLSGREARRICPYMSEEVMGASWCPSDGNANPLSATLGYYRKARELGVRFVTGEEVLALETVCGAARRAVTKRGNVYEAEKILVAAGYESREITASVGIDIPLIRKYDECIVTEAQPACFQQTLGTADADFYGHQTEHGSFVFGGDCGFEFFHDRKEETTAATANSASCMARNILRYFPALSDVRVIRQWGGWLDKCMDGVPVIDQVDEVPGLFLAAGFSGHGFGIAPAVDLCLSQLIMGEKTAVDLSSLAYDRFTAVK